jgi:hypothetical protein
MDCQGVVDEHVASLWAEGLKAALLAVGADLIPGQGAEFVAAGKEVDWVVRGIVEVDAE